MRIGLYTFYVSYIVGGQRALIMDPYMEDWKINLDLHYIFGQRTQGHVHAVPLENPPLRVFKGFCCLCRRPV